MGLLSPRPPCPLFCSPPRPPLSPQLLGTVVSSGRHFPVGARWLPAQQTQQEEAGADPHTPGRAPQAPAGVGGRSGPRGLGELFPEAQPGCGAGQDRCPLRRGIFLSGTGGQLQTHAFTPPLARPWQLLWEWLFHSPSMSLTPRLQAGTQVAARPCWRGVCERPGAAAP